MGEASEEEIESIFKWIEASENNKQEFVKYKTAWAIADETNENKLQDFIIVNKRVKLRRLKITVSSYMKYAAILICIVSVISLWIFDKHDFVIPEDAIVLELKEGKVKIIYDNVSQDIENEEGDILGKQVSNKIAYQKNESSIEGAELVYHTLSVPFGKKFQLELSDGSSITLNSGSSIKYPVQFIKGKTREVFLKGEAYFKVSEDKENLFVVHTSKFDTQVYGTEFNISSYENDAIHKVVLVSGSIGVQLENTKDFRSEFVIKPNEMILINGLGEFEKKQVDVFNYIAWVEGVLVFQNEKFENIIKKLERHYDVSIENNYSAIRNNRYTGVFDVETIDDILKTFAKHRYFTYVVQGDEITINH